MEPLSTTSRYCPKCQTEYPPNIGVCPKDGVTTQEDNQIQSYHPLIGKFIGSYRIKKQIGSGAAGEVFLGEHPTLAKRVAIKVLKPKTSQDRELVARFFAEAKAVSLLEHPNIVAILDLSVLPDGRAYYIMEFLEGQSLARRLAKQRQIVPFEAISLCLELLKALGAAHRKGIIHRDVKPANLFLVERAGNPTQVKLLDFGIAKLLNSTAIGKPVVSLPGTILGTPAYMAPEQCFGGEIRPSTDLYAVGMVLYEMLAGELPLGDTDDIKGATAHLRDRCAGLPAAVEAILAKALDPSSQKRFSNAEEMSNALRALQTQLPPPEESLLVATNPRVMLPTPKANQIVEGVTSLVKLPEKERPKTPKPVYVSSTPTVSNTPPPPAPVIRVEVPPMMKPETPTVPIYDPMPPAPVLQRVQPVNPYTDTPAPPEAKSVPVPQVRAVPTPVPTPAPVSAPHPKASSSPMLWVAILLGGLLALGLAILFKLQTQPTIAPAQTKQEAQEVEIAVGSEPNDAQIKITAEGEVIAQGNGKLSSTLPPNSRITIEITKAGYQTHRQTFTAKSDAMLQIYLAPDSSPNSQATVTYLPVPTKQPNKPNKTKPTDTKTTPNNTANPTNPTNPANPNNTIEPNDSLDDDKAPAPNDSLDDDPAPTPKPNPTPTPTPNPKPDNTPKPDENLD